jgi:hypothetical protein
LDSAPPAPPPACKALHSQLGDGAFGHLEEVEVGLKGGLFVAMECIVTDDEMKQAVLQSDKTGHLEAHLMDAFIEMENPG